MWKLTISHQVSDRSGPGTRVVTRTSDAGFNWEHIDAGNGLWQFADNLAGWSGTYSRVVWFTEELVEDEVENGQEAENGQEVEEVPVDDGYEGGF